MSEEHSLTGEAEDGDGGDGRNDGEAEAVDTGHLDDVEAGAGCAEIWEHLSERREQAGSD
jgi:hypothetical protein